MGPVSVVRRPGWLALVVLLVAVLAAMSVSVLVPASAAAAEVGAPDAGVAAGGAPVDALAPSRAVGRLVAEPSLVRMHGPSEGGLFGTLPPGLSRADLLVVGDQPVAATAASGAASQGLVGVRGPPYASLVRGATS